MLVTRRFKFRLYPTKEQEEFLAKQFGCCRFVYNYFLDYRRQKWDEEKLFLNYFSTCNLLTALKKENTWLAEVISDSLQQSLKDLDIAFKNFIKSNAGYPKFKKKCYEQSFRFTAVNIVDSCLRLPKLTPIKMKLHRSLEGYKLYSVTVIRTSSSRYYASIVAEREIPDNQQELDVTKSVGLDYSSAHLYVTNVGAIAPKIDYSNLEHKISVEQRKLSRMKKGSNNYNKQRIKLALVYERLANKRANYLHTLSHNLATSYDYICIENLSLTEIAESQSKLKLGKSTYRNSFSSFVQMLYYKLEERGRKLIKIDRYFPSSQFCSCCGYHKTDLTLADRKWQCPNCHTIHNRDTNAAVNILREGLRLAAQAVS